VGGTIFFGSGRTGGYGGWDLWQSDAQTSAVPEPQGAGQHRADLTTKEAVPSASSGVCYCKMRAGGEEAARKVTVLPGP
jgi:hypothetical protein